jgi:hypothetical protein
MDVAKGLTEREARMRREHGEGNEVQFATGRSYADIARANIFNLFNAILVTIGGLLITLGRVSDALISHRSLVSCERRDPHSPGNLRQT